MSLDELIQKLIEARNFTRRLSRRTSENIGDNPQGFPVIKFDGVTGTNVNFGAGINSQTTNIFMIKGTKSPSVVPLSPKWRAK